jgi:hypothetical protein
MADWAAQLSGIPSSNLSELRRILIDCDARLQDLMQTVPDPNAESPLLRKSSRPRKAKIPVDTPAPTTTRSKQGQTYINSVKVRRFFFIFLFS